MMGFGMGFGMLGLLVVPIVFGVLIFLAVWAVRTIFASSSNNQSPPSGSGRNSTAQEILAQRYARGEITRQQYELMKQDIN